MKVQAQLTNNAELLLRHVNPSFIRAGRPSHQVFKPKPKDDGMLSVGQESKRSAADAFAFFTNLPKCRSLGLLAVTVGECTGEELPAHDAPMALVEGDLVDDDAHAIINFTKVPEETIEEKAISLHRRAMARGYVFQPTAPAND